MGDRRTLPRVKKLGEGGMLTPHFGIFNPPPRQPRDTAGAHPAVEGEALDRAERYSSIERDALLLTFGQGSDLVAARTADDLPSRGRPWRFLGVVFPPYI